MSDLSDWIKATLGKDSGTAVNKGFLARVLSGLSDAVIEAFQKQSQRITTLERRIDEAQSKGFGLRYAGVYREGKSYEAGQFATHQGGLWHCNENTDMRPGSGPHWTLAVKSGRDQ